MSDKKNIFEKLGLIEKKERVEEVPEVEFNESFAASDVNIEMEESKVQETVEKVEKVNENEKIEKKLDVLIESYEKNKLLSIDDIYRKNSLESDMKRTIFMADVYVKALPENLPVDIKRESVLNIMKASDVKLEELLQDAYKRIDALNNVLESVANTTEEMKRKNNSTIKDFENRIGELKKVINDREKFQDTQNTTIEYEIQRIINIVDFVKPKI